MQQKALSNAKRCGYSQKMLEPGSTRMGTQARLDGWQHAEWLR
jgi:hypothetical protein